MEALDAIRARQSVREYRATPIPRHSIEQIVDCGRLAPTARGEEPWEFIAVTEKTRLTRIADITDHGKFIRGSACAIIVCSRDTKYYLEDGCAATENILVGAAALGIGSCWVAGDKKAYCQELAGFLGMPAGYRIVSIIALGYPAGKPAAKEKRPLKELLHWESF